MSDVQVAVGLGREARGNLDVFTGGEILVDDLANEVARGLRSGFGHGLGNKQEVEGGKQEA